MQGKKSRELEDIPRDTPCPVPVKRDIECGGPIVDVDPCPLGNDDISQDWITGSHTYPGYTRSWHHDAVNLRTNGRIASHYAAKPHTYFESVVVEPCDQNKSSIASLECGVKPDIELCSKPVGCAGAAIRIPSCFHTFYTTNIVTTKGMGMFKNSGNIPGPDPVARSMAAL
ncbi:hypothetical protein PG984_011373 [Apiospora sp. TS-2023a]